MPAQGRRSSGPGPATPSPRAAWTLLGTPEGLGDRLRGAADALGDADGVEAAWLRGAAELIERGEGDRRATRSEALWLEEMAAEARAHKVWLLAGWVNAAEALRSAIHAHESERGPLVEALFPAWRGASLRRHLDQALAAEAELQRRLASGYVVRRLAELSTRSAVGPALEALAAAGAAWAAERERPALAGAKADEVRDRLLAVAREAAHLVERVRWLVRAALARRPELLEVVFPKRGHSTGRDTAPSGSGAPDEASGPPAEGQLEDLAAGIAPARTAPTSSDTERDEDSSTGDSSAAPAPHVTERTVRRAPRPRPAEAPPPDLARRTRRAPPHRRSAEASDKLAPAPEEGARAPHAGVTRRRSSSKVSNTSAAAKPARALHAGATRRRPSTTSARPVPAQGATRRGPRPRSRPPRRS